MSTSRKDDLHYQRDRLRSRWMLIPCRRSRRTAHPAGLIARHGRLGKWGKRPGNQTAMDVLFSAGASNRSAAAVQS